MAGKEDSMSACHLRPPEGKLPSRAVFGRLQVDLRGLDVYDPTSGEIRSSSTGDIACWSIDSDYNEESFFVAHASFTIGCPFDVPTTGRLAVKVINHYGDEVLKVHAVPRPTEV